MKSNLPTTPIINPIKTELNNPIDSDVAQPDNLSMTKVQARFKNWTSICIILLNEKAALFVGRFYDCRHVYAYNVTRGRKLKHF